MIRTFHHRDTPAAGLFERKRETRISVVIPARDEAATIGPIVEAIRTAIVDRVPLVDELVVMDDHSTDATARIAAEAGARVESAAEILPELELGPGKGEAMWKSLVVTEGDVVAWCDADIVDFDERFVVGILGPLLEHEELALVKGYYDRPTGRDESAGGGRVTELVARPLVSMLFPQLAPLVQPLAGEYGGRRTVLESVPFAGGYGVELGLLIDIAERYGAGVIAQVDLGVRHHRNRPLDELGPQAAAVLHTALERAAPGLVDDEALFVRPGVDSVPVAPARLPPMTEVRDGRRHSA
jgi:glucosyl-3-phosphoglycerate synthase